MSPALLDKTGAFFVRIGQNAFTKAKSVGAGTARRDQILACVTAPFFVVAAGMVAQVAHEIMLSLLPDVLGGLVFVQFLLGMGLVIGTIAVCFAWIKTGGFHVFA